MNRHRPRRATLLICTSILLISSCSRPKDIPAAPLAALQSADTFELFSIKPENANISDTAPQLQGYEVLGRTKITDPATRTRLIDALRTAARQYDGSAAACFNPRHAIQVTHAGVTTDFLICFECRQVEVFNGHTRTVHFFIDNSAQPTFDATLKSANIPLAPPSR
jgi:hypothetical protein